MLPKWRQVYFDVEVVGADPPMVDTAETVHISSLALLKVRIFF